jgi:hypothetical protein
MCGGNPFREPMLGDLPVSDKETPSRHTSSSINHPLSERRSHHRSLLASNSDNNTRGPEPGDTVCGPPQRYIRTGEALLRLSRDNISSSNPLCKGEPPSHNSNSGNTISGARHSVYVRSPKVNFPSGEALWRKRCEKAGLQFKLLTEEFDHAYSSQIMGTFVSFRKDLRNMFLAVGASEANATIALETFCFRALEKYFRQR